MSSEGEEPTEAEAKIVLQDVLAKEKTWNLSGQPEKVPGGFIIRGTAKYENGTELMAAIDANFSYILDSQSCIIILRV